MPIDALSIAYTCADSVYLDHAGATMYSSAQLQRVFTELSAGVFSNPHSSSSSSSDDNESTAARVERVRRQTMQFFRASEREYELVFTSGATAALQLVGECFPWQRGASRFAYSMDSHTSVLGIRGYAAAHGVSSSCVSLDAMARLEAAATQAPQSPATSASQTHVVETEAEVPRSLFAFPAECNFSGTRHALSLVQRIQVNGLDDEPADTMASQHKWFVLLDAAKYVGTHQLDLSTCAPDFAVVSFYKMVGYPTGLGALLIHKRAIRELRKTYFGGGAVESILATQHIVVPRSLGAGASDASSAARFADGTQSFLAILALRHGLETLARLGMARIDAHTTALTQLLVTQLRALRHANDAVVCEVYGHGKQCSSGAVVACNLRRSDGSYVGYAEVAKLAALQRIQLRTGCFCNPGACQAYLALSDADVFANMDAGHVCGDDMDVVNGRPTGAVRLSLGYMSTFEDVAALLAFIRTYFVSTRAPVLATSAVSLASRVRLCKIALFPIKSCRGMTVSAWPVGGRGLLFDREWAIVDAATHKALTLKDVPALCFVRPRVDLERQTLTITFQKSDSSHRPSSAETFVLSLSHSQQTAKDGDVRDLRVCAGACKGREVLGDVSQWLSARLERACALVRVAPSHLRDAQSTHHNPTTDAASSPTSDSSSSKIGFANQAQFLLVSRASVAHLNTALRAADAALVVDEDAFRANLIIDGCDAFAEDAWTHLRIYSSSKEDDEEDEGVAFDVSGPCSRCSMINVDPRTGAFNRAPLQTLSQYRRERSSIFFGQFLTRSRRRSSDSETLQWLRVDDRVLLK